MSLLAKWLYLSLALAVVGAIYALGHWSVNVRFQHPALNNIALAILFFSIPILFMASACVTRNRLVKAVLILLGIACLLPAVPIGSLATFQAIDIINSGKDGSFEKVYELPQGSRKLRLYVSDCGATCDYGLVLQEETEIPIGIKITHAVWSAYHTSNMATMQRLSDRKIRIIQSDGDEDEVSF